MRKQKPVTLETHKNLQAVKQLYPGARSVTDGLMHLLNTVGREATTVYRLMRSYDSKLTEAQIARFKRRAPKPAIDHKKKWFYADESEAYMCRTHGALMHNSHRS